MSDYAINRKYAMAAIAKLALAFSKDMNEEQIDLSPEQLSNGTNKTISNERFFPAVATLRSAALEHDSEPSAEEAWGVVIERIRAQGKAAGARSLPSLFQTAIQACGGWPRLCESTNPVGDRITFVRAYNSALTRQQKESSEAWIHPEISDAIGQLSEGANYANSIKML